MSEHVELGRALRLRAGQWQRFAEWEARESRLRPRSFEADLAWFADALALSDQLDPDAGSLERVRAKASRLARLRALIEGRKDRQA